MNFLDVEVKEAGDGRVTVASPALEPVSIPHAVGRFAAGWPGGARACGRSSCIPGEFADRGHLHGQVSLVERLGTETVLNVELTTGGRIVVALDGDRPFDLGHGAAARLRAGAGASLRGGVRRLPAPGGQ